MSNEERQADQYPPLLGVMALACYAALIVGANELIAHFGAIPVFWFGVMAPAGTLCAGAVFVARDVAQLTLGRRWVLVAIVAGAALSYLTSASLATASGVAFLIGELADWALFTPLRNQGRLGLAFLLGNVVGLLVDTFVFLPLALGWGLTEHLWYGTALGKLWVTLPAFALVCWIRRERRPFAARSLYLADKWRRAKCMVAGHSWTVFAHAPALCRLCGARDPERRL